MKNILIATDFSKEAYCALHYSVQLFRDEEVKFYIANFYGDHIHESIYSMVNEEEFSKSRQLHEVSTRGCNESLHQIIRDTDLPREMFEALVSDRPLIKGIEQTIQEKNIDLVVMGTRKHKGSLASLSETHTTKLIDRAISKPILIVPREMDFERPEHIAFASDLKKSFDKDSLSMLKQIAKKMSILISVVYEGEEGSLSKKQWSNFNEFKSYMEDVDVHLQYFSSHIEISRSIAEFVKTHAVDMLCMIYYKHGFAENIFREPVVENLDRHLSFPFLILPE